MITTLQKARILIWCVFRKTKSEKFFKCLADGMNEVFAYRTACKYKP